jgi:hypothetical protein
MAPGDPVAPAAGDDPPYPPGAGGDQEPGGNGEPGADGTGEDGGDGRDDGGEGPSGADDVPRSDDGTRSGPGAGAPFDDDADLHPAVIAAVLGAALVALALAARARRR